MPGLPDPVAPLAPGAMLGPAVLQLYSLLRPTDGQAEPLNGDRGHPNEAYARPTVKTEQNMS